MKNLRLFLWLIVGLAACSKDDASGDAPVTLAISEVTATTTSVHFYLTTTHASVCRYAVVENPETLLESDWHSIEILPGRMTPCTVEALKPDREYTICAIATGSDGSRVEKRHPFITSPKPAVTIHRVEPGYNQTLLTLSTTNASSLRYACVEKGLGTPEAYTPAEIAETLTVPNLIPDREYTVFLLAEKEGILSENPMTADFRTLENPIAISIDEIATSVSSATLKISVSAVDLLYYCLVKASDSQPEPTDFQQREVADDEDVVELVVEGLEASQNYVIYLYGSNAYGETAILKSESFETDCTNLSDNGNANCYVITTTDPVKYKFDATVKGNSSLSVGSPVSASLIWEDLPGLITSVSFESKTGTVSFIAAGRGNGVIAVRNEAGEILWSWHIWCTGEVVQDDLYTNFTGSSPVLMDRNLGAVSAEPFDPASTRCMIYQWGRKDPFPNMEAVYVGEGSSSPVDFLTQWPVVDVDATGDAANNNLIYAVQNPMRFITGSAGWFPEPGMIGEENTTADLWGNKSGASTNYNGSKGWWSGEKTIYDPCPAGYRVPGVFVVSGFTVTGSDFGNNVIDPANQLQVLSSVFTNGWLFKRTSDDSEGTWYPMTGCRLNTTGACSEPSCIYMWFSGHNTSSSSVVPGNARTLYATANKFRAATFGRVYAYGCPVRCQRIPDDRK